MMRQCISTAGKVWMWPRSVVDIAGNANLSADQQLVQVYRRIYLNACGGLVRTIVTVLLIIQI